MKISSLASFTFVIGVTLLSVACKSESSSTKTESTAVSAGSAVVTSAGDTAEPAPAKPETLRIPHRKIVVGTVCTKTTDTNAEGRDTNVGEQFAARSTTVVREEVLAAENNAATRSRVTFSGGGAGLDLDGLTFEVWREQGDLRAKLADGTEVTAKQLASLETASLIKGPTEMEALIASRDWTVGERYTHTATDFPLIEASDATDFLAVTLSSSENYKATFSMELNRTLTEDGYDMVLNSKGEFLVHKQTGIHELSTSFSTLTGLLGVPDAIVTKETMQCEPAK